MATKIRNFRIDDEIWSPFSKKAKELDFSTTTLLKVVIKNFLKNPRIVIEDPELLTDVPPKFQKQADNIAKIVEESVLIKNK